MGTIFLLLCSIGIQLQVVSSLDPCLDPKELPRANYRGGECAFNAEKPVCDRNLQNPEPAWYRAKTATTDVLLQSTPAEFEKCGTRFPYWMNGTFPTDADGEVDRDVCQADLHSNCASVVNIKVKSCTTYFIYRLPSLPSCAEAYCFGKDDPCPPFDPCDVYDHKKAEYDMSKDNEAMCASIGQCDAVDSSLWYRFAGGEDLMTFLNSQRAINCTSDRHTWIQGSSSVSNVISNHTLCVEQGNKTCVETYHVSSKQCQGYNVYRLPDITALNTCAKLCLGTVSLKPSWYTCRAPERNFGGGDGGESNKPPKKNKGPKDYLWTIGLVAGVAIGAIVATVVVLKFTKKRASRRKINASEEDMQKQKNKKLDMYNQGHDSY